MVDTWCKQRETENNNSCITRIYPIIDLIRYLRERGKTEVEEPDIPRKERRTYIPHAFTQEELTNFFRACDEISISDHHSSPSRKITVPVFFRLLYSSGIRTCEARLLRTNDVDLINGVLNIRLTKGRVQHFVALHETMLYVMKQYDLAIRQLHPNRLYFFPDKNDSFHNRQWVQYNFKHLWNKYNTTYSSAYELRHNYAVENINKWTNAGFNFDKNLFYLSKSMGHCNVESTKYYYSLTPVMADILESHSKDDEIIPEVQYGKKI